MSAPTVPPTFWLRILPAIGGDRLSWKPLRAENIEDALFESRPLVRAADETSNLPVAGQVALRRGTSLLVQFILTPGGHAYPTGVTKPEDSPFQVPA